MKTKVDLHVHSRYSNKPSYWALRKFRCPESFTSPQFIYETCKKIGMDYVTITDHNCIRGALEIAHHPDTFISSELTAYFPEDGCKVHVVALDIEIWPTSIVVPAGYRLILTLAGRDFEYETPGRMLHDDPVDRPQARFDGMNTIHTGGTRASFLLLPHIP